MKLAICGDPSLAEQIQASLKNTDAEFKFFLNDSFMHWGGALIQLMTFR